MSDFHVIPLDKEGLYCVYNGKVEEVAQSVEPEDIDLFFECISIAQHEGIITAKQRTSLSNLLDNVIPVLVKTGG